MSLFLSFLRSRRLAAAAYVIFVAVYAGAFLLYHIPLGAVLYPAAVCAFLGLCLLLYDFGREKKKHDTLADLLQRTAEQIEGLPPADSVPEADYAALVELLRGEIARVRADDSARFDDMIDYYSVWAHQIKTPIASMKLALQSEDSPLSRRLSGELFRIEQYVGMVLAFLRLDSDSTDYVFRRVALDDVVRAAVRKFAPTFIGRHIRLEFVPSGAEAVTDEKWLGFVIEQVLSNALKYTREGGSVKIEVAGPATLRISDTGIGIAASDLPRIFEKGYTGFNGRGGSGSVGDRSASGIGLYLCRRVCRALGATISAESEVGVGTTVSVSLPQDAPRVE